jgi:hypothetical protein
MTFYQITRGSTRKPQLQVQIIWDTEQ